MLVPAQAQAWAWVPMLAAPARVWAQERVRVWGEPPSLQVWAWAPVLALARVWAQVQVHVQALRWQGEPPRLRRHLGGVVLKGGVGVVAGQGDDVVSSAGLRPQHRQYC